jgi:hypothetical protein
MVGWLVDSELVNSELVNNELVNSELVNSELLNSELVNSELVNSELEMMWSKAIAISFEVFPGRGNWIKPWKV